MTRPIILPTDWKFDKYFGHIDAYDHEVGMRVRILDLPDYAGTEEENRIAKLAEAAPDLLAASIELRKFLTLYPHPYAVDIETYLNEMDKAITKTCISPIGLAD